MVELCDVPEDIETRRKIPKIIQQVEVEGVPVMGAVRLLDKALHGQPDAPRPWETLHPRHAGSALAASRMPAISRGISIRRAHAQQTAAAQRASTTLPTQVHRIWARILRKGMASAAASSKSKPGGPASP